MSDDFRDRLEQELRVAHRRAAQPKRRRPRPRLGALVPAAGLALAVAFLIVVLPAGDDPERPVPVPAAPSVPQDLRGTYAPAAGGGVRLWIQAESVRVLGLAPDVSSELLGFASVNGGRITLRVDRERASADAFPGPLCERGRVGDAGVYRFSLQGRRLGFRLVEDPCHGRAELLTGRRWVRAR